MSILCNLSNINLNFGEKNIFTNARFTISENDRVGLIGLNGQGKSTLFNIITGKQIPDISEPAFIFDKNKDLFSSFLIPQELDVESFPDLSVSQFYLSFYPELYSIHRQLRIVETKLIEDFENTNLLNQQQSLLERFEHLEGWRIESSYLSYLNYFELENREASPNKLSGGEQRKIALSIGLSTPANFILWDEPTNHLDIETIKKFEDELENCQKTYMIISHDRYLLNNVTNKIVHIENGKINSFQGTYLDYLEHLEEKEKERVKHLDKLQNKHRRELAWMRQGIKARGTRSKKRVEGFENIKTDIQKLKEKSRKLINIQMTHTARQSKQLIEIKDGNFGYQNELILKNLNLKICKKDKVALIGANGAGKSTLINILRNQLQLNDGVRNEVDQLKVIVFDQKRASLDLNKTPYEIVGAGQDFVHFDNGTKKHVMSYLEDYLFPREQIHRPSHTLSGGEKNRLQLAMFMRQSADLWIFDEPTNDLDIETIEILEQQITNYEDAVLIIGHDRAFLDNTCSKTWLIHEKQVEIFEGGYSQVEPYLEAIELEKGLKETTSSPEREQASEQSSNKKSKMSYIEKQRWKVIEEEIAQTEKDVELLKNKMAQFDYQNSPPIELENLHKSSQEKEQELERLYLEWEDLSNKEF